MRKRYLETSLFNEKLPNPIGLAVGFDKSAEVCTTHYLNLVMGL